MSFYGSGVIADSGSFYSGVSPAPTNAIPQDLRFYRTSQDGIYVFWWGFLPAFITPSLTLAGFDLQLDTSPLFSSPNLVTWTQSTAITFQNGNVRKGFAVPVAARINATVQTWYARVRTHTVSFISDWSSTLIWTIPQSVQQSTAEALMESLPDYHVYGKGDLLKPVNQRNSNLWLVEDMYGNQFDQVYYANFLTQTDNFITLCIDENLFQNFGVLFNYPKPNSMQFVDYRWILMNLIEASLVGGTDEAITLVVQSFTGVPPQITNVRDEDDFFLSTVQDPPITQTLNTTTITSVTDSTHLVVGDTAGWVPGSALDTTASVSFTVIEIEDAYHLVVSNTAGMSGGDTIKQSVFYTSYPFVDSSLVVENITTGLLQNPATYTTDGARSNWTMLAPTTDTLQATFDIRNFSGPPPVVFDAMSGWVALSGLVTFTNESTAISGVGTHFMSGPNPLVIDGQVTDPTGIYLGTVASVTSDTSATLLNPWGGPTEVVTGYLLEFTDSMLPPPLLWDKSTLAFGVIITILNPGQFALS